MNDPKWNDMSDEEIASTLKKISEALEIRVGRGYYSEVLRIGSERLLRASTRHRNLSAMVFNNSPYPKENR